MPETPGTNPASGLRRPAAVLVLDLVRHSTRRPLAIRRIQRTLENVFVGALKSLSVRDVVHNYTGDGYVCAFLGDDSGRVIDFLNAAIPELKRQLQIHEQSFRAGLDFGFLQLRRNSLTGDWEHFDMPGIVAARLQSGADAGQILASETLHKVFVDLHPDAFSEDSRVVHTKDRELTAYEVQLFDSVELETLLSDFIFDVAASRTAPGSERRRILIADDNSANCDVIQCFLESELDADIVVAPNGAVALDSFEPDQFSIAFIDIMMPKLNGYELVPRLLALDDNVVLAAATACNTRTDADRFFSVGGHYFLTKPIQRRTLCSLARRAIDGRGMRLFRAIESICDVPGNFLFELESTAVRVRGVLADTTKTEDLVHSLIQHKAKHTISDFLASIRPGNDLMENLNRFGHQVDSLCRLGRFVTAVREEPIWTFLQKYADDMQLMHRGVQISLTIDHGSGPEPSSTVLALAACELIDNAVSAISDGGCIEVEFSTMSSMGQHRLVVKDSGPGVSAEHQARLFEEGFSTKGTGRGLGLKLVRSVVDRLGGKIEYGKHSGACFTVLVPTEAIL